MEKLLNKHWALIGLIVAFLVDHTFDILKNSGLTLIEVDLIKGLGVIIVGYFWNPSNDKKPTFSPSAASKKGKGAIVPSKGL